MKNIKIKYVNSLDKIEEMFGPQPWCKDAGVLIYKVYFSLQGQPITFKGFGEDGKIVYKDYGVGNNNELYHDYFISPVREKEKEVTIFRKRNKMDKLELNIAYVFIVKDENGELLEQTTYREGKITSFYKQTKEGVSVKVFYEDEEIKKEYWQEGKLIRNDFIEKGLLGWYLDVYWLYRYDDDSNLVRIEYFTQGEEGSEIFWIIENKYSAGNKLIERKREIIYTTGLSHLRIEDCRTGKIQTSKIGF